MKSLILLGLFGFLATGSANQPICKKPKISPQSVVNMCAVVNNFHKMIKTIMQGKSEIHIKQFLGENPELSEPARLITVLLSAEGTTIGMDSKCIKQVKELRSWITNKGGN